MKNIFIVFFLSIFLAQSVNAQHFHWKVVLRDTSNNNQFWYSSISCVDDHNISIIGNVYDYSFYFKHLFLSSSDGGDSWYKTDMGLPAFRTIDGPQFKFLSCADSAHLFAVGDSGIFISSSDAGRTWSAVLKLTFRNLTGISFYDLTHGLVVDQAGDMFTTTDGGLTWKSRTTSSGSILTGCKTFKGGKYFVSDQFYGKIFRSSDYGDSWDTVQVYQTKVNGKYAGQTTGLYFQDTLNGFIRGVKVPANWDGQTYYPLIVKTSDGGTSWKVVVDSASPDMQSLFSMCFLSDKIGIAAGNYWHDLITNDGGNTWAEDTLDAPGRDWTPIMDIAKLSATKVLAQGGGNVESNVLLGELATNSIDNNNNKADILNPPFYPNPATSNLSLRGDNVKKIVIYDLLGRKIKEFRNFDFSISSIDCSELPSGIYWIEITKSDNAKTVYKLIRL